MSKKYKNDYEIKLVTNENGITEEQIVYNGDYYLNNMTPNQRKQFLLSAFIISFISMWLFFVSGFFDNGGSYCLYVMLPYVCLFLPAVYFILGAFAVRQAPEKMVTEQYHKSYARCVKCAKGTIAVAAATLGCEVLFFILNRQSVDAANEMLFLLCVAVIIIINFIFLKLNKNAYKCIIIQV